MNQQTTTYQLIETIDDMRLDQFIDCICDQKLEVLIISGTPSTTDLLEKWGNLFSQYLDILDDSETIYLLQLQRDIELLKFKIVTTEAILKVLGFFHVESLVSQLKYFGFTTVNLKMGHSGYQHALKKITARISPLKLKLAGKEDELREYHKDKATDTVSRPYYSRQLQRLSKHQGYPVRPKETLVPEYVAILKDFISQNTKSKDDGQTR